MADIIVELARAPLGWLSVPTLDRALDRLGTAALNDVTINENRTMVPSHVAVSYGGGGALKPSLACVKT